MAEDSAQTVVAALSSSILPLVPELVERMHEGIDVLDVGCGSGRALCTMARDFPSSRFVGYDISEQGISAARERAGDLRNVNFEVKDVTQLPEADRYDLITAFDVIHDQIKPLAVLKETAKSLKPDGVFLMQDIRSSSELENNLDHPVGPFLYTIPCLHCMTVSLARKGTVSARCGVRKKPVPTSRRQASAEL